VRNWFPAEGFDVQTALTSDRLKNWWWVLFVAAIPYMATLIVRAVHAELSLYFILSAPELLFITIVVPVRAWNDVRIYKNETNDTGWSGVKRVLIGTTILGSGAYFLLRQGLITGAGSSFRFRMMFLVFGLVLFTLVVTTFIECMLAHAEYTPP